MTKWSKDCYLWIFFGLYLLRDFVVPVIVSSAWDAPFALVFGICICINFLEAKLYISQLYLCHNINVSQLCYCFICVSNFCHCQIYINFVCQSWIYLSCICKTIAFVSHFNLSIVFQFQFMICCVGLWKEFFFFYGFLWLFLVLKKYLKYFNLTISSQKNEIISSYFFNSFKNWNQTYGSWVMRFMCSRKHVNLITQEP